jgi:hypothetical protein
MIKKLLLVIMPCMLAIGMHAQTAYRAEKNIPVFKTPQRDLSLSSHFAGNKGTATGGSRWYIPFQMIDVAYVGQVLTNSGNAYLYYMDWDSTLYQQYNDPTIGLHYASVNWTGIGQFVDPIWSVGFTQIVDQYSTTNDIYVLGGFPYSVDSIAFRGAYMQPKIGPRPHVVDTLYCSIAPIPYDSFQTYTAADTVFHGKVVNYDGVAAHGGEMKILTLWQTDSTTRQLTYANTIKWKVPLDSSLRDTMSTPGSFPTQTFVLPVNNGASSLNVPPGWGYAITVAFKPGGGWNHGDSVGAHDYFMYYAAQAAAGQRMPYFYYDYNDRNMSFLGHQAAPTRYGSTYRLEMRNQDDFSEEFIWLGGHVVCSACWDMSVAGGNKNLLNAKAYPNPANNELNIPVTLMNAADVHVSLTNAMGQVVASQTVKNITSGKAVFNTASLCSGIYFYTVEAGGERKTGRVTIAR